MVTAKQVINSTKPNITKVPKGPTQKGSAGYDNPREDIEKVKKVREIETNSINKSGNDLHIGGNVGVGTDTPIEKLHIPSTGKIKIGDQVTNPGGKLRVTMDDTDAEVQGIKVISMRTTGTNYGYNGTAAGVGATKNVGLYSWASGATTNLGLWIDAGTSLFDDDITVTGNIAVTGTVDGIDVGVDVAANTAHRNDNTQAHSDYLLNTGDTASGDYNFDSNTLLINSATNRVGFGESAPDTPLHVKGLHVSGEGLLKIEGTTSHAYFTVEGATAKNSGLFFKTAGANNFLLDNIYGSYLRFYNYAIGGNNMLMYGTTGRVSMGNPASINPNAQLKVSQTKTDANACEVLHLKQAPVADAFLRLEATTSPSLSRALVNPDDYTNNGELKAWAKVYVHDGNIGGITDQNYYLPLFDDAGDTMTLPNVVTTSSMVLPVKTTTGDQGSPVEGQIYVNTFDNKVRCYADGAWRDLATW